MQSFRSRGAGSRSRGSRSGSRASTATVGATSTYLPPTGPTWPPSPVVSRFNAFVESKRGSIQIREAVELLGPGHFQQIKNKDADWDILTLDLALMTLRQMLKIGKGIKPEYRDGQLIICNSHVQIELQADYQRLRKEAYGLFPSQEERRSPHFFEYVARYIKEKWVPNPLLMSLISGAEGLPIDTPPWWNAAIVIIPWSVQESSRCIVCLVNLIDKRIYVLDPHYWQLDPPVQDRINRDLLPLYTLLPHWLSGRGYWHCNAYRMTEHAQVFELGFYSILRIVRNLHGNISCGSFVLQNKLPPCLYRYWFWVISALFTAFGEPFFDNEMYNV